MEIKERARLMEGKENSPTLTLLRTRRERETEMQPATAGRRQRGGRARRKHGKNFVLHVGRQASRLCVFVREERERSAITLIYMI
jgi:hypothetical protein